MTALATGARVGVYEIVALLGAGGMGEVYRARDTKLGRALAIKVLPASVAADPDRLARLEREARLLASLNHPNIGAIYGVEEAGGMPALVLELVEGETLAQMLGRRSAPPPSRLERFGAPRRNSLDNQASGGGSAGGLGLSEALAIARQIADALDAAHERGIVHRDLKPANVEGARLRTGKGRWGWWGRRGRRGRRADPFADRGRPDGAGRAARDRAVHESRAGARKIVDKRTDIWAFGCLLYEMLTGRRAFAGDTTTDTLAKILERDPDWSALPPAMPPGILRLLQRCLEKDPKLRLRDIADARAELDDVSVATPVAAPIRARPAPRRTAEVLAIAAIVVSVVGIVWWLWLRPSPARPRPAQFTFAAPDGERLDLGAPIPSPDGSRIAFIATSASGTRSVWIRRVDSVAAHRLAGTEEVDGRPFWSPDSRFLGFFAQGKLKKIDPSGGPALNIGSTQANLGASWGANNIIVVAPANRTVLHRVSAAGGTPEPFTTLNTDRKENSHRWPHFLPDGRHFLFTARSDVKENNLIYVGSVDSKDVKALVAVQSNAVYVSPGYLVYARDATLMAQRFDVATLSLVGDAMPVAASVGHSTASSSAAFGASADGSFTDVPSRHHWRGPDGLVRSIRQARAAARP